MTFPATMNNWVILAVDDEPDNLGVVEKLCTFRGAKVYTARNGYEGLELLEKITPTIILLDLAMPKMDGWTMYTALREKPALAQVPVIAMTAHVFSSIKNRALEMGFVGYIEKPFRVSLFFNEIERCLANKQPMLSDRIL